ncbi:DedA family protein, partial [Salmonella enterica subsp. enterica serovar Kentucky]
KKPLHSWSIMKKNKTLLEKTEHPLHHHRMFTILDGPFVGPTTPLVPMVARMQELPEAKNIGPNNKGSLLRPPFYFQPGNQTPA